MDLPFHHFCRSYSHCALDSAGAGREVNLASRLLRRLSNRRRDADGSRANLVGAHPSWPPLVKRDYAQGKTSASDTGPYGFVRHPIYTGLIIALLATAVTEATPVALSGAVLIALGLWVKARAEERFLLSELGQEAYESYRRRVPMLVPFLPHR